MYLICKISLDVTANEVLFYDLNCTPSTATAKKDIIFYGQINFIGLQAIFGF